MARPGPRNLITDVPGILVGNAWDARARTGVTVVLADPEAVAAVDVRGGAPGTRETDALGVTSLVRRVPAICLSGGSAFGLAAADGAMAWLAARGRGFRIAGTVVPVVPTAILFDLANGGDKDWGGTPPHRALAVAACDGAAADFPLGNVGAGCGAKAGSLKGGLGSASVVAGDGLVVGALVAVNAHGETVMPGSAAFWAWPFEWGGEFGGARPPPVPPPLGEPPPGVAGANTTIAVVATNAPLGRGPLLRVAMMAHDGLARAIRPAHTPFDGDTVFALSTGDGAEDGEARDGADAHLVQRVGALAADALARAVARGVYAAETLGDLVAYRDRFAVR